MIPRTNDPRKMPARGYPKFMRIVALDRDGTLQPSALHQQVLGIDERCFDDVDPETGVVIEKDVKEIAVMTGPQSAYIWLDAASLVETEYASEGT